MIMEQKFSLKRFIIRKSSNQCQQMHEKYSQMNQCIKINKNVKKKQKQSSIKFQNQYKNISTSHKKKEEEFIFLDKYRIIQRKNKYLRAWSQKNINKKPSGLTCRVQYVNIFENNKYGSKHKNKHFNKKQTKNIRLQNQIINQFQRLVTAPQVNQTKINESSTKTTLNAIFHSNQIINSSPKQSNQRRNRQNNNAIIQQQESSKSNKTSRNQSGSQRKSKKSSSIKSLKSSLKNSIFLPVNSLRNSNNSQQVVSIEQLQGYMIIENYLQLLDNLGNYAGQIIKKYQNAQDWQQLIFLTYKKYYLYRLKLYEALFYRNTLFFDRVSSRMTSQTRKSLKIFMNSINGQYLRKQIMKQNIQICNSLRNIYNIIIKKSGNFINLTEIDNFSCEIYRLISQQIEQLKRNYYASPQIIKERFKTVIRCLCAIAELDQKEELLKKFIFFSGEPICIQLFERINQLIKLKLI